jgi:hypothetical protein
MWIIRTAGLPQLVGRLSRAVGDLMKYLGALSGSPPSASPLPREGCVAALIYLPLKMVVILA